MAEEKTHALLSGSSAHRWMNCFGFIGLSRSLPKEPVNPAAQRGTLLHTLAEKALSSFFNHKLTGEAESLSFLVEAFPDVEEREEVLDLIEGYVDAIWKDVLEQSLTGKYFGMEEEFAISKNLEMWGTPDFWCIYTDDKAKRVGVIEDFKTGWHYVSEKNNAQLAFYACALRTWVREKGKDLDLVRVGIYQPPKDGSSRPAHRMSKFTSKQLDVWEKKFFSAAESILIKKSVKQKAGHWCEFCRCQGICKAYAKSVCTKTNLMLIDVKTIKLPPPETLTDRDIAKVCLYASKIEAFLKATKSYAIERFEQGTPIKGLKVVETQSRRKWAKDEAAIGESLKALGIDNPYTKKLITLGAAEKILKTKVPSELTDKTSTSLCVVSEDDERPSAVAAIELINEKEG